MFIETNFILEILKYQKFDEINLKFEVQFF